MEGDQHVSCARCWSGSGPAEQVKGEVMLRSSGARCASSVLLSVTVRGETLGLSPDQAWAPPGAQPAAIDSNPLSSAAVGSITEPTPRGAAKIE